MKPIHGVVAGVLVLVWIGVLAFVLTHGKDQGSGVDVYSELPPGFTAALQTKGVTFSGLSPVDGATVQQVLATPPPTWLRRAERTRSFSAPRSPTRCRVPTSRTGRP